MKKILILLIISLFAYQNGLVLAIDKNIGQYNPLAMTNTITKSGRISAISIKDNWLVINGNSTISKFRSAIVNMFKIQFKVEIITYRVNILDNTELETINGKAISVEELRIDDYAAVTGRIISETTNKIDDYKTEKVFLIEASYIKINNRRGVIESIANSFTNYFQNSGLISLTNRSSIITDPNGTIEQKSYDNTAERQGKCVGYKKPIVENRESAPDQPQVCCEGLKAYEALSIKFEDKPTVNIQGYIYTVKAYCYGLDGIPSDITGKVFEKEDCISEGEPLLIGGMLAPKVLDACCKGLVECVSDTYKSFPQPTGSEVVSINGFNYIVKGFCRKECAKKNSSDDQTASKSDLKFSKDKVSEAPWLPHSKASCKTDLDCPWRYICANGLCVWSPSNYISRNTISNKRCNKSEDCAFNGKECVTKELTLWGTIIGVIINGEDKKCACVNNMCSLATLPPGGPVDSDITCGDEVLQVCGKNNITYRNPCEAVRDNTQVQCSGACPCKPVIPAIPKIIKPGTIIGQCSISSDCEACGLECFESTQLDQLKSAGKQCDNVTNTKCDCIDKNCILKPPIADNKCDDIVKTVCGNDGKTYINECEAIKAGTSVNCLGNCPCNEILPPEITPVIPSTTTTTSEQTCIHPICGDGICHPWEKVGSSLQGTCYCLNADGKTFRFKNNSYSVGHIVCTMSGLNINFCKKDCFPTSTTTTSTTTTTTKTQMVPPPILPPIGDNPAPINGQPEQICVQPVCGDGICHDWEKNNSEYQGTCMCNISSGKAMCTTGGYNLNYCPVDCGGTTPPTTVIPPTTTTTTKPSLCTLLYDPVCGSDGNIYSNDCFATSAGVDYICRFFTDLGNFKCQCN